mgnify:CR=1 FL=1
MYPQISVKSKLTPLKQSSPWRASVSDNNQRPQSRIEIGLNHDTARPYPTAWGATPLNLQAYPNSQADFPPADQSHPARTEIPP